MHEDALDKALTNPGEAPLLLAFRAGRAANVDDTACAASDASIPTPTAAPMARFAPRAIVLCI
jgi:hypothetical protein